MAVGLALAAHAWLLAPAPRTPDPAAAAAPTRLAPLQVRHIVQQPLQHAAHESTALQATTPTKPGPGAGGARAAPQTPAPALGVELAAAQQAAEPATTSALAPLPSGTQAEAPATSAGATPLPVYTTQLAPAATLHYQLRRKAFSGQATLQWQPAANGYQISLQGQALGMPTAGWVSQGEFDSAGIAPARYSESRRGREQRAANFQRGLGRITYSGPAVAHALVPGAQDRLSWLLQLGAVLAANPALAQNGAQVAMLVVGSRGDATAWTFEVQGMEAVRLPDGSEVQALHLHRAPQRPYDTHADVWLDPARHHLPVRLHLQVRATGEGTDYLLERLDLP